MKLGVQALHKVEIECVKFGCYSLKTKVFINMFMCLIFLGHPLIRYVIENLGNGMRKSKNVCFEHFLLFLSHYAQKFLSKSCYKLR